MRDEFSLKVEWVDPRFIVLIWLQFIASVPKRPSTDWPIEWILKLRKETNVRSHPYLWYERKITYLNKKNTEHTTRFSHTNLLHTINSTWQTIENKEAPNIPVPIHNNDNNTANTGDKWIMSHTDWYGLIRCNTVTDQVKVDQCSGGDSGSEFYWYGHHRGTNLVKTIVCLFTKFRLECHTEWLWRELVAFVVWQSYCDCEMI